MRLGLELLLKKVRTVGFAQISDLSFVCYCSFLQCGGWGDSIRVLGRALRLYICPVFC